MICPDADCRSAKKKAKSVRVMNVPAMSLEERMREEKGRGDAKECWWAVSACKAGLKLNRPEEPIG